MKAEITGWEDDQVGVYVYDAQDRQHGVVFNPDGSIAHHQIPEPIPLETADRTDAEKQLLDEIRHRARFEAHTQTECDLIQPSWDPQSIRRIIDVIEQLPADDFEQHFHSTYHQLQDPPHLPIENIDVLVKKLKFANNAFTTSDLLVVGIEDDEYSFVNKEAEPDWDADAVIALPPMQFDFEFDGFRGYLIHHLKCQIRDIYTQMGEQPPEDCQLEGLGKLEVQDEDET